jgi:hypothetical protein
MSAHAILPIEGRFGDLRRTGCSYSNKLPVFGGSGVGVPSKYVF